jgi:hypothetical protein
MIVWHLAHGVADLVRDMLNRTIEQSEVGLPTYALQSNHV